MDLYHQSLVYDQNMSSYQDSNDWNFDLSTTQEESHQMHHDSNYSFQNPLKRRMSSTLEERLQKRTNINSFTQKSTSIMEEEYDVQVEDVSEQHEEDTHGSYYSQFSRIDRVPLGCKSISEVDSRFSSIFPFQFFNHVQSECLDIVYHSDVSSIISFIINITR